MSQRGAQQAAREGLDCYAIIAFYYPGTEITTIPIYSGEALEVKPQIEDYSLRKDGEVRIASNFKVKEFAASGYDKVPICYALFDMLQRIRDHFGKAVNISDGYRPDGRTTSQHYTGRAADFRIIGVDPREIVRWIEAEIDPPGLGLYDYNPKTEGKTGFVHIDARTGAKSRWYQTKKDDSDYTPIGTRNITDVYLNK